MGRYKYATPEPPPSKPKIYKGDSAKIIYKSQSAAFLCSDEWRRVRYQALTRYGNQCMCCGRKPPAVALHVDHIKPRCKYPLLALDINNLQILCADCNFGKGVSYEHDFRGDKKCQKNQGPFKK